MRKRLNGRSDGWRRHSDQAGTQLLHIWFSDQSRLYARRDALEKGIKFFVVFVLECAHLQQI